MQYNDNEEDYELMALLESISPSEKKEKKIKSRVCIWCNERSDVKTMNGDECKKCVKKPFCIKCEHNGRTDMKMAKRTNGRSGKKFWGCGRFPECRFTMELDCKTSTNKASQEFLATYQWPVAGYGPSVSQTQEEQMVFEQDKWYILHKPSDRTGSAIPEGRVTWEPQMDEFDGAIVKILRHEDSAAHVYNDENEWAFHIDWATGPFKTKEDALRSQITVSAPRPYAPISKIAERKNMLNKIRGRWKSKKPSKEAVDKAKTLKKKRAEDKYQEWNKKHPIIGSKEWLEKQNPPSVGAIRLMENENEIFTEIFDGKKWMTISDGASAEIAPMLQTKMGVLGYSGASMPVTTGDMIMPEEAVEISLDAPTQEEFNGLKDQVEALVASKKKKNPIDRFLSDKAIEKKYQKDIDSIFNDYHERNRRREELTQRIDSELVKNKVTKRSWKTPVILTGCFTAIVGSVVVLYPYVGGLIQAAF